MASTGDSHYRQNSPRLAGAGLADFAPARCRRHLSARNGMSIARIYRRRFGRAQFRYQARLRTRCTARISGSRCSESGGGARPRLSGRRRLVAVRCQRQSRCPYFACARLCIAHAFGGAAVSHWVLAKSAQGCARGRRIHSGDRFDRCAGTVAHVADQQAGFLCSNDCACRSAPVGHSARHTACCRSFGIDPARASITATRRFSRPHTGDDQLFRFGPPSGK